MPDRIALAVEAVAPRPGERILEIGGGYGIAAGRIAALIGDGHLTGIDRSAKMTTAATRRNAEHVTAGRATFLTADIASWDPGDLRLDAAFAINVIAFADADHPGHRVVRSALASPGRFCIAFQPPEMANQPLLDHFAAALTANGYDISRRDLVDTATGPMVIVIGRV